MKYKLACEAGEYRSNWVIGILWAMLTHRMWHLCRGDGWVD